MASCKPEEVILKLPGAFWVDALQALRMSHSELRMLRSKDRTEVLQ